MRRGFDVVTEAWTSTEYAPSDGFTRRHFTVFGRARNKRRVGWVDGKKHKARDDAQGDKAGWKHPCDGARIVFENPVRRESDAGVCRAHREVGRWGEAVERLGPAFDFDPACLDRVHVVPPPAERRGGACHDDDRGEIERRPNGVK